MKKLLLTILSFTCLASLRADEVAFQLAFTPDVAIHPRTTYVRGISLDIWGENPQTSFNLGVINGSTGESVGFSWALLGNYAESYTGIQWGFVNYCERDFLGWQGGLLNISQGNFTGLQTGFVNYAENLKGIQLGLLNIAMNNPWFSEFPTKLATGFPIVNWSF
ncbi:MAG: hypothetical protein EPO07_08065 [Verrucomicrobia bacterium]|nr:MAG: hypothetical protein EPO07_08065 [Verrucomicrobiota bacterium]